MSELQPAVRTGWWERGARSRDHALYLRMLRRRRVSIRLAQAGLLALLLLTWEVAADHGWINAFLTSQPSTVWRTLSVMAADGRLWLHTGVTLQETVIGFVSGSLVGLGLAIVLWWLEFIARVLDPYLVVLNSLPKIALGPIFYVWLGDRLSVYGMALSISVVVTMLMVLTGLQSVDRDLVTLLRSFGATRWQVLTRAALPASLPTLVASLKVNLGLTMVGVIVGEFLSSKAGLGYLIVYGGQIFRLDLVMTSVLILAAVSAGLYLAVSWLESRWLAGR